MNAQDASTKLSEVSLRASRRAGELLKQSGIRHGGDRRSSSHDENLKLADLGVEKDQSSRWQRIASIRAACLSWMRDRQLGRRNLTPDQRRKFLGDKYNAEKKSEGAPKGNKRASKQLDQDEPVESTAERIAAEHGVSPATVKRAGKFAAELEKDPAKKKAVMEGKP